MELGKKLKRGFRTNLLSSAKRFVKIGSKLKTNTAKMHSQLEIGHPLLLTNLRSSLFLKVHESVTKLSLSQLVNLQLSLIIKAVGKPTPYTKSSFEVLQSFS